jgi:RNA polymerase sigma factor (sigma-70 family)
MTTAAARRCLSELDHPVADAELVGRYARAADAEAFAALVRRHGPVVLAVCRRVLGNAADADDAFQAVFLRLARRAGAIRDPRFLPGWLHRVAVRVSRRALAKRRPVAASPAHVPDSTDPFGDIAWRDLRRVLDEELDRLPEAYRTPLVLCLLDGLTRDEAATRIGCSLNTVRRRIDAGRELLRARLVRRGVGPLALAACALEPCGLRASVPANLGAAAAALGETRAAVAPAVASLAAVRFAWVPVVLGGLLVAGVVGLAVVPRPVPSAEPQKPAAPVVDPETLPAGAMKRFADDRFRHPGPIVNAALSADGKRIATVSPEVLQIADADTGMPIRRIALTNDGFGYFSTPGLAFSPDGKYVACALNNELTAAWETDTGREVFRLPDKKSGYALCQFTPDGKLVLRAGERLRFLELPSGKETDSRPVGAVSRLTRDAALFVRVVNERKEIALGDAVTGKETHRLAVSTASDGRENGLAFSPDGKRLAVVHDRREVQVWDTATGAKVRTVSLAAGTVNNGDPSYAVGFSGDGGDVHFGTHQGFVLRWRVADGAELPTLSTSLARQVCLMTTTPDGRTVVTADYSGGFHRWDAATGKRVGPASGYTTPIRAAFLPTGGQVVVADAVGRIDIWDAATGKVVRALPSPTVGLTALDVSPDGKLLAVGSLGGGVHLVRVSDGEWTRVHTGDMKAGQSRLLKFSPDGAHLLAADWGKQMRLIEVATGNVVWTGETVSAVGFVSDGQLVWGRYKNLAFADARTGNVTKSLKLDLPDGDGFFNSIGTLAVSPDGKRIACAITDGQIALFDSTGRQVLKFTATEKRIDPFAWKHPGAPTHHSVESLSFSADGKWLLAGAGDHSVRVWEVATGKAVRRFDGHLGTPGQVAFTPDGRAGVSAGAEGFAYLWDLRPEMPAASVPPADLWKDAAGADAGRAARAAAGLVGTTAGRAYLRDNLPAAKLDATAERIGRWIDDLGSADFAVREAAEKELAARVRLIEERLRAEVKTNADAEVRTRLNRTLARLDAAVSPDDVRVLRVVRAAETAGTAEARELLTVWAAGTAGAVLTADAKAALVRALRK